VVAITANGRSYISGEPPPVVIDSHSHFRAQRGLPDRETLLAFSPEQAAELLLRLFPKERAAFVPTDTVRHIIDEGYGRSDDLDRVLMEGVSYLDRYGLLIGEIRAYGGAGRMLSRKGKELAESGGTLAAFTTAISDQRALLHPDVIATALPLYERGPQFFDPAVAAALKCVEVAVRQVGGFSDSDVGVPLMRKAFGEGGPLRNEYGDPGEENGYRELLSGAMAVYKNPPSHRYVGWRNSVSVLRILVLASELLHTVEDRITGVLSHQMEEAIERVE
jgi:uncharacterized protein (TIGR02391 family)